MSDEVIIRHCSPTLAGLKTGNLFLIDFETKEELMNDLRSLNDRLAWKGLRILPVHYSGKKVLLYMYRESYLERDLENGEAADILKELGYECSSSGQYVSSLIRKFKSVSEFPHEIGLFLGYPPEDVRGFIENKAHNFKCVGTWKVYGDEEKAKRTFKKFKKCSVVYYEQWRQGKSIERLTVAV